MSDTFGYAYVIPSDEVGTLNPIVRIIEEFLKDVRTVTLGVVKSVTNSGLDIPAGTVSVQPLVSMTDGNGNALAHGDLNNVPYFRLQAGANAIIMDPQVGDIGILLFADRDISSAKASQSPGPPPSGREFDMSDCLYLGGILGTTVPTQSVQFTATGMILADKNANQIVMSPGSVNIITPALLWNGSPVT